MASPPMSAVRTLWDQRIATNDTAAATATLRSWSRAIRTDARLTVDQLIDSLTNEPGSLREGGAWYQVLAGWPNGFPPDRAFTPLDRYPFDPTTGPGSGMRYDPHTGQQLEETT